MVVEPDPILSYFTPRVGAEKKYLEPEPKKNGSAPQHWFKLRYIESND